MIVVGLATAIVRPSILSWTWPWVIPFTITSATPNVIVPPIDLSLCITEKYSF
jgi:hypothetical protein